MDFAIQSNEKKRERAISNLRNAAQKYDEEKDLFNTVMLYYPRILDNPKEVQKSQCEQYNNLVRNSGVPLPRRSDYYIF